MDAFGGVRASKAMAAYALHTLEAYFQKDRTGGPTDAEVPAQHRVYGMFVSYEDKNGHNMGCIGTFSEGLLRETIGKYALVAALEDTRFEPIGLETLPAVMCKVTLLSQMLPAPAWDEWVLGQHGIYITLREAGRRYTATFLPDVAPSQGWDKTETFRQLLRKSGYRAAPTVDVFKRCEVLTYEGSKADITYAEYHNTFRKDWC
ncbi:hypothetical protein DIPPA_19243 [Diplonema papillatum]|nr:hypothetical protein DIPPA_19243 [Diplonema papillatum]